MTSKVVYTGGLRCESTHTRSQQVIHTDAPPDNHGRGEAFSPTDLLSTSLANCMLTIMGIAAGENEKLLKGAFAEVTKVMASGPRRVSEIHLKVYLPAQYPESDRLRLEQAGLNCPVAKSLHPDIVQDIEFYWTLE
ncbi:MAG: OsmC family protein [Thermaurantimonas aggregans]|nr:OsmC family protein [Thermaurantimonas aggregans]MCX8148883.1 OsmC family protein [Thermaurantimonas aggregans]